MPIPDHAYVLFAQGDISEQELLELEKFAESLEKTGSMASMFGHAPAAAPTMFGPGGAGRTAAALGGLALAAPTLAYMGTKVPKTLQGAVNSMRFESGLSRAIEVNPQLGSVKDPNLRMAYKTLQTTNPEYAKDPLIAGTILDMVMANRMDPNDPSSAPRFDPTLLNEIQKSAPRTPDTAGGVTQALSRALPIGE
jgi:hypothetical protein